MGDSRSLTMLMRPYNLNLKGVADAPQVSLVENWLVYHYYDPGTRRFQMGPVGLIRRRTGRSF